jgi:hypothetical protein
MAGQTQDWFAQNAPKSVPPPAAAVTPKGGDWFAANAPKAPAASTDDSGGLPLHELSSSNPQKEGLYHMKDAQGHSFAVPFSSVELAGDNWRNMFSSESEAEQYEKDKRETEKTHPIAIIRRNISPEQADVQRTGGAFNDYVKRPLVNTANRAARGIVGQVLDIADDATDTQEQRQAKANEEFENSWIRRADKDKTPYTAGRAAKDAAELAGNAADIFTSSGGTRGREFVREAKVSPMDATTNLAGDALAIALPAAILHGAGDAKADLKTAGAKTLRRWAGADSRATESLVNRTITENKAAALKAEEEGRPAHDKEVERVRQENEEKKATHEKAVADIRKENEDKQAAHDEALREMHEDVSLRTKLSRSLNELKSRIIPKDTTLSRLKIMQDGAKQYFKKQYDTLSHLTSKQRGDLGELTSLLDEAEGKIQGSDTKVAVFGDIRKRVNGEISSQTPPAREVWEEMSPEAQAEWRKNKANAGISYEDLRGYYRELGKLVGSDSTPGDIKTSAGFMRDGLEKMQGDLAEKAGLRAKNLHAKLSKEYKDYAQTMLDRGSPVTKMLNAKDADTALKTFEGMTPFQKSYALDLLKGTGEHSDWLRRADRLEGEEGPKVLTPVERRANAAVVDAQEKLDKAKSDSEKPPTPETAKLREASIPPESGIGPERRPAMEGLKKAVSRAEDELEKAKANAERVAKLPRPDLKRRLRNMKTYREETAQLVRDYLNTKDQFDGLGTAKAAPKPPKINLEPEFKPTPEPEFTPPKDKTISRAALKIEKEKATNDFFDSLRRNRIKVGIAGVGTITIAEFVSRALGFGNAGVEVVGGALAGASLVGPTIIMKMLRFPGVAESLKFITKADTDALAKLSPSERVAAEQNIISMTQVAKSEGIIKPSDPTPLAKFAKQDLPKAKEEAAKAKEEPKPEPPAEEPPAAAAPASEPPPTPPPAPAAAPETPPAAPQAAEAATPPPAPVPAPPAADVIPSRRLEDLKVDPKRFQYKLGGNKAGVTDAMSDAKWDQGLADPIHIWEDPETGEEFVVNGHHRYKLAKQAVAERINVQPIDNKEFPTAADARVFGALKNIADGNGTSVDAAKFFREGGYKESDLRKTGLSLKKAVANEGLALSKLSDDLFNRVVDGNLDSKLGAAIGEATDSAVDQEAILKDVQRREKAGRPVSAEQIRESARLIKQSPTYTSQTQDLFGNHEEERNLFLEMGEVSEYIQKELADEKRAFGRIATKGASEQLAKGENIINPQKNAEISKRAAQLRELYLKRSAQAGPVHAALQEAAERLAEGEKPNAVKQDAFDEIREHLDDELGPQ